MDGSLPVLMVSGKLRRKNLAGIGGIRLVLCEDRLADETPRGSLRKSAKNETRLPAPS